MILLALILGTLPAAPNADSIDDPATASATEPERPARWTLDEIFAALRQVETGGSKSGGRRSVGDGGKAIGPLQIHRAYWQDSGVPGRFEDCRELSYARKVALAYWRRYCPKALEALDAETLARVHNGGPKGARKESTKVFWSKVERELARRREKSRFC
ncbi:MAG: hypothetical protein ACKVXR_08955 [Planctomycetota bacterium]